MERVDAAQMRARNTSSTLQLIRENPAISRAEIARSTGLSRSTVSSIIQVLLEHDLIQETGSGNSSGGRKPISLRFNHEQFFLIGVDVGATHIAVILTNLAGEKQSWQKLRHPVREDPEGTLNAIKHLIRNGIEEHNLSDSDIVGLGVALPSPIDPGQPGLVSAEVMPAWRGTNIQRDLEREFNWPVFLDNDANLGALGELWWGPEQLGSNLAFIKLGTGIGCGIIMDGKICRGSKGLSGEIGHTVIDSSQLKVPHDGQGTLSNYVGAAAILRQAQRLAQQHPDSHLAIDTCSVMDIAQAAQKGDKLATGLIQQCGHYIGLGIANLLNLLNPDTIILGGAITIAEDLLLSKVQETIQDRVHFANLRETKLMVSSLGEFDIATGAATQVLNHALQKPCIFPSWRTTAPRVL